MDAALKTFVINAVNNTYIYELHTILTGYMGALTIDIINHMMARYGRITAADIKMKKKSIQEPIDTSQTINIFRIIIDDGVQYYSMANTPYTPEQVLQMAYHAVSSSGIYSYAFANIGIRRQFQKRYGRIPKPFAH